MDLYRFQGTCIVEHWDVSQTITGNETNPIAFF
jgi:predicted SnoaL-like aldol condensation-catalyzing enzyme